MYWEILDGVSKDLISTYDREYFNNYDKNDLSKDFTLGKIYVSIGEATRENRILGISPPYELIEATPITVEDCKLRY